MEQKVTEGNRQDFMRQLAFDVADLVRAAQRIRVSPNTTVEEARNAIVGSGVEEALEKVMAKQRILKGKPTPELVNNELSLLTIFRAERLPILEEVSKPLVVRITREELLAAIRDEN